MTVILKFTNTITFYIKRYHLFAQSIIMIERIFRMRTVSVPEWRYQIIILISSQ